LTELVHRGRAIDLPVSSGYRVTVDLAADDTYTVRRVFTRGSRQWVKGEVTGVYCDQVGEAAYLASCFRNAEFGGRAMTMDRTVVVAPDQALAAEPPGGVIMVTGTNVATGERVTFAGDWRSSGATRPATVGAFPVAAAIAP